MFFRNYLTIYLKIGVLTVFILLTEPILSIQAADLSRTNPLAQLTKAKEHLKSGDVSAATSLLTEMIPLVKTFDIALQYQVYFYLGNAYLLQGQYQKAIDTFLINQELSQTTSLAVTNNLFLAYYRQGQKLWLEAQQAGNVRNRELEQQRRKKAEKILKTAEVTAQNALSIARNSPQSLSTVRAWLNWQKISENFQPSDYQRQLEILRSLPPSSGKARLLIEIADYTPITNQTTVLEMAIASAQAIQDYATLSLAWGTFGALAEAQEQITLAQTYTLEALKAAEREVFVELMYRWQWQLGRIYQAKGQVSSAIGAYSEAISLLELIKEDLLIEIRNKRINWTEEIEPIYRQYLSLLLSRADYQKAWVISESLSQSELESHFGDNCFTLSTEQLLPQPPGVVLIRSIIFQETTYLMLKFPGEKIKVFPIKIAAFDLNNLINQWRYQLEFPRDNSYRVIGQKLYQLLIDPIAQDLERIEHLIFINDGLLRTIPLTALYNGHEHEHLIEQYSVSYAVSSYDLSITNSITNNNLLAFGLTNSLNNYPALPQVAAEILALKKITKGQFFLNQEFTTTNLEQKLAQKYSSLHLATHSSFSGNLETTYLQAYDRNISLLELEQILLDEKFRLQLLVLSSCETAMGNEDALLGLAGIGIRANIANIIGSLWAVNSNSTVELLVNFYQSYFLENITSAEALRQAQIRLVARQFHPYYWSGFINIY